jgi:hypothetical protein
MSREEIINAVSEIEWRKRGIKTYLYHYYIRMEQVGANGGFNVYNSSGTFKADYKIDSHENYTRFRKEMVKYAAQKITFPCDPEDICIVSLNLLHESEDGI